MRSRGEIGRKVYENHTLKRMLWYFLNTVVCFSDATVGFHFNTVV